MISKSQQKLINSLKLKKNRIKTELFVAEGEKVVKELLNSKLVVDSVFCLSEYIDLFNKFSSNVFEVNEKELSKISNLKSPNKVLAVFKTPSFEDISEIENGGKGLILALDNIRDPGNLGTIIRLADWFGVRKIICSTETVDAFNPKVVMATMGSISRVNIEYCNLSEKLESINSPIYGAFLGGENIYKKAFKEDAVLVIGNESNGISEDIEKHINSKITIPQFGKVQETESLNASVATAIL